MVGNQSYASYTAWYNECAPTALPRFTSYKDLIKHAKQLEIEFNEPKDEAFVTAITVL